MYHGNEKIKWMVRISLNSLNKELSHFIQPVTLKEWNAFIFHGRKVNIKQPKKLNEKILWLSYYTDTSLWSQLADKYCVRKYIKSKGLSNFLVPIYGVYEKFDDIPFEKLPNCFVLKATHGCDMNYICKNKKKVNMAKLARSVDFWLTHNLAWMSLELHYSRIKPRILCEKLLKTKEEIIDYKFFCLNGRVSFVEVCSERSRGPYLDLFDRNGKKIENVIIGAKQNPSGMSLPEAYFNMINISEKLAEELPFVRVDLYYVNNQIYFGEMTFTPATGLLFHFTDDFLLKEGNKLNISELKKDR